MKNIRKLYRYISDERTRLITTALISAALGSVGIISPLFYRSLIDHLTTLASHPEQVPATSVLLIIGALAGLNLLDNIFSFIQERLTDRMTVDIEVKLRQRIFEHMMTLSIDYYEQTRVGETMIKTQNALYRFTYWLQGLAEGTLTTIIQLTLAIALLWFISPLIGVVVSVLAALGVIIQVTRIQRSRAVREAVRETDEKAGGLLGETITHISTVRSSLPSSVPIKRFRDLLGIYRGHVYEMNNIQQYGNLARGMVYDGAMIAAVAIIAWKAVHHGATAGDVVAVALYLQQINGAVGPLGRLIVNTSEVETSVGRITTLLETEPGVVDTPDAVELDHLHDIEFKNVSFAYPEKKRRVLKDIRFKLEAGQTLALVGPSGTGKTTITKLMLRFYEPSGGQILINGQPIERFTTESIRKHIGMVMQDVALFNDSVTSNLQLATPKASPEQVKSAARLAHADVFIERLAEGYDTMVGERGIKLSGGEKQRVAIARAALKDPDLIILDEATSALDSESERHVQAGLRELLSDRTAVIIAHRLSTVMRADHILVLKDGKLIEQGTHQELAANNDGLYAKLFKLQTQGFVEV